MLNKVMVIGHLGRDAELKFTTNGDAVCNFSVATTEKWNDRNGEKQEKTEWHRIVLWGKVAESLSEYLVKGKMVYVEGKLETRQWEKDGQKHYTTEIKAYQIRLLGGSGSRSESSSGSAGTAPRSAEPSDDDIPF
jgi:single-strand DNA-binding protein